MRPCWDDYYMDMLNIVKSRSTCLRRHVSAIIVKDNRILSTGYNGAPKGIQHCEETGCLRAKLNVPSGERHELCRGIHAEQNAIIQASVHGVSIDGAIIYISHSPCSMCSKMIINAGIKKIIFKGDYPDPLAIELLQGAKIELVKYKKNTDKENYID